MDRLNEDIETLAMCLTEDLSAGHFNEAFERANRLDKLLQQEGATRFNEDQIQAIRQTVAQAYSHYEEFITSFREFQSLGSALFHKLF